MYLYVQAYLLCFTAIPTVQCGGSCTRLFLSQASAVAYGNVIQAVGFIYRETCVFPPVGQGKPLDIFKLFFVYVTTLVSPTDTPNSVEIGSHVAPPHSGGMSRFCNFCTPFFIFLFPHFAYRSQFWTDSLALWLKRCVLFRTRAFLGFGALKVTFRGVSGQKKTLKFRPVFGPPICCGKCFSNRALKSKLPVNVKVTPQSQIFDWKLQTRNFFLILAVRMFRIPCGVHPSFRKIVQ